MSGAPKPRTTASLTKALDTQLNLYALAAKANCRLTYAAAAGVTGAMFMSLAPVADARIVYTPAHVQIPRSNHLWFDFNPVPKAGDYDFGLVKGGNCRGSFTCVSGLGAVGYTESNLIAATSHSYAIALRPGQRMGPRKPLKIGAEMGVVKWGGTSHKTVWYGQWANGGKGLKNGYLGLKFVLNGKVHYGWARVSLTVENNRIGTVTLTGYAFETIPNKPIIIGKTHGPDVIVKPATLGTLAAGAAGSPLRQAELP